MVREKFPVAVPWTFDEALIFVRRLTPYLEKAKYGVALGGSVLVHGRSDNDLDIVVYPFDTTACDRHSLNDAMYAAGMTLEHNLKTVRRKWVHNGSHDQKHVEVWKYEGKRVDVFTLS